MLILILSSLITEFGANSELQLPGKYDGSLGKDLLSAKPILLGVERDKRC